jgi:TPR repeat protein
MTWRIATSIALLTMLAAPAGAQTAEEQYELARMYATGEGMHQDPGEARRLYRLAAEQGLLKAQYAIARVYTLGVGSTFDDEEAAVWYRVAAERGHVGAQHDLGAIYDQGRGVAQDYAEAAKWYRAAAAQGDANSQAWLAQAYVSARGVPADLVRAHVWFSLAAPLLAGPEARVAGAQRDAVAARLTPAQLQQAQELARVCRASNYADCG